ncbi:hypothetical protein [Bordetella flabilis]|uniref:Uncharacterized protein n=1 Tax=Bordetella flabilis TaxID=463014 RepID=A0A193GJP7_9BORD|nr:hypothetical protein [Bordetella flabilis]ANN79489.1 hypothetical protein BAU07_22305 [Bordetella flabilis]
MTVVSSASLSNIAAFAPSLEAEEGPDKPRAGWLMDSFERDLQASMQRSMSNFSHAGRSSDGVNSTSRSAGYRYSSSDAEVATPAALHDGAAGGTPDVSPFDAKMTTRISAYNKMIADGERILVNGPDGVALPTNPLTVRAWLFNIGLAFDKVNLVIRETDAPDCQRRKDKVERVLHVFRNNGIFELVVKAIKLRLSYDDERARAQAERLIRYAFGNSI